MDIPTFLSPPNKSFFLLDLAIASANVSPLRDHYVFPDSFGSDHFPIGIRINCLFSTLSNFSHKLKLSKNQLRDILSDLSRSSQSPTLSLLWAILFLLICNDASP